jgi:PQQ-dependent dehydrogenase (s-GDH family)
MRNSHFLYVLFACLCLSLNLSAQTTVTYFGQTFIIDTLYPASGTTGMSSPWEIVYGPDDSLWVTASHDYKIYKINPSDKGSRLLLDLNSSIDFTSATANPWPQGGLMGLAIHPEFYSGKPWVYVAYVYHLIGCSTCAGSTSGGRCSYNTKIARYKFNFVTGTLTYMDDVITGLDGSNDHNSGRIRISPLPESDGNYHLYYSIGDMGAGQLGNICRAEFAQDTTVIEGKTLRLNTEPDLSQPAGFQWIPTDNPFPSSPSATTRSPIYTFGHRNPQGMAFGSVDGGASYLLYSCEHGDRSDDEVNILTAGRNYGWPKISGLCDDNYTSTSGDSLYLAGQAVVSESGFCDTTKTVVVEPIFSYYNWTRAQNKNIATNFPGSNMNWPTVAPSSLAFYSTSGAIPGWGNSLLMTSLKNGLWRLQLKSDGLTVDSTTNPYDTLHYLAGYRLRNVTLSPTEDTIFLAVDNSCCTLGPTGTLGNSVASPAKGFILRMIYITTLSLADSVARAKGPAALNDGNVRVYPNPAHGVLNVSGPPGVRKPWTAQLYSMTGKMVAARQVYEDSFSLDVGGLQPGVYVLRVYGGTGDAVVTKKVLVE